MVRLFVVALLVALLCGCAAQPAAEELLRAPQLSPELSVVQRALNAYLGESAQLKYPRGSETSSPFLFSDLDGDGAQEAVVLYQSESKGLNVHLAILEKVNEEWVVTQEVEGPSTDVESISQGNLQYGTTNELLVLYSAAAAGAEDYLAVYSYVDDTLKEKSVWPCTGYLLEDLTGAGKQDVVMVREQNEQLALTILTGTGDKLHLIPDFQLDKRFYSCEAIAYFSKDKQHYIIVDGLDQSGYLISQLLCYDPQNKQLSSYLTADMQATVDLTARLKPGLLSTDINNDGIVEIPVVEQEITTVNSARRLSFVTWRDFTRKSNSVVQFGILDMEYGYFLRLPTALMGKIMVVDGIFSNSWQVCSLDGSRWYLNVTTYGKEKQLPSYLQQYQQLCMVGQTRVMVQLNQDYFKYPDIIFDGVYLV